MLRRHPSTVVAVSVAVCFVVVTPFLLADASEAEHPTAAQLFDQGMQRFEAGDLEAARTTLRRVDPMQLSKENRVKMYETLQELDRQTTKQGDASALLSEADEAAKAGQTSRALSLYEEVTKNSKATERQKQTAAARLTDIKSRQNAEASNARKSIDSAAADIKAGRLDAAEAKLKSVKSSGIDLGWFDNERVDRQLAEIAEKRSGAVATVAAADAGNGGNGAVSDGNGGESEMLPPVGETPAAVEEPAKDPVAPEPVPVAEPVAPAVEASAPVAPADATDLLAQVRTLAAQEQLALGRDAEAKGQTRLAQQHYQEATRLDPTNAQAKAAVESIRTKVGQDASPKSVLETQLESGRLIAAASVAEFRELLNRAESLRTSGNFVQASEAISQAKVTLDRNERVLPPSQYRALREEANTAAARIFDEQRKAEAVQQQSIEAIRQQEAIKSREDALRAQDEEVQRLLRRALELRRELKYDQCLELINQALFLSPNNAAAQAMKEMVQEARLLTEARELLSQRAVAIAGQAVDNIKATIPYNELMVFPPDWPQLTFVRLRDLAEGTAESKRNQAVADRLSNPIRTVDLQSNRLINVIEFLKSATGQNFFVNWNALQQVGVEQDTPISLQLENVPAELVLRLVLQQVPATDETNPVTYSIIEGVINISTRRDLTRTTDTRVYDIRDLLHRIDPVEDVPRFDLTSALESGSGGSGGGGGSTESIFDDTSSSGTETVDRSKLIEDISVLIQDTVGRPEEWASAGGDVSSLRELNGNLIVKTTPENHRGVIELLGKLRETRAMQISVEARFLLVDQNFLDEVGVDLDVQFNDPGGSFGPIRIGQSSAQLAGRQGTSAPSSIGSVPTEPLGAFITPRGYNNTGRSFDLGISYIDDVQVNLLINATQATRRSIGLTAPRVTFLNGQEAYVTIARQISFISDLEPVSGGDGFDPTLSVVQSGATLFVRGTISADRRYVTLSVRPSLANVIQPIRTIPQTAQIDDEGDGGGDGTDNPNPVLEAFIEAPEVELITVETTVSIPDRGTLLLGGQRVVGEIEVEAGVPVISKIPLLNRLTTNRSTTKDERTLLILLKPTIIIQNEEEDELFPGLLQNPAQYNVGRTFN